MGNYWVRIVNETDYTVSFRCELDMNQKEVGCGTLAPRENVQIDQKPHKSWIWIYVGVPPTGNHKYYHLTRDYSALHRPTFYIKQRDNGKLIELSCDKGGPAPVYTVSTS